MLLFLLAAWPAQAQLTTGTVRGTVEGAQAGVRVEALNPETGFSRSVETRPDGTYILSGLRPGNYRIAAEVAGRRVEEVVRLQVAQTLTVNLSAPLARELGQIVVEGVAPGFERRTSEVGTNVTQEQIESLPQSSRNFQNFARLAPGVRVSREEFRQTFSGGATNATGDSLKAGQTNVFIDGASLKSNVQQGSVAGQDASFGNPFSQLAVQEFKVLTQNFKAEFEQAGSSIITAVTKSGTNEFHGEVFGLFARKPFTENTFINETRNLPKPDFTRTQFGGALGGPIIKDKLFFFLAYEGNRQERTNTVTPGAVTPEQMADLGFDPQQFAVSRDLPFREHLIFGKLNWDISDRQLFEVSTSLKRENDFRNIGGQESEFRANQFRVPVSAVRAKHQYFGDAFINELSFDWRRSIWDPNPVNPDLPARTFQNVILLGGRSFQQNVEDTVYTLRNNLTFSDFDWHGNHIVKTGVRLGVASATVLQGANINPEFIFRETPRDNVDFTFPAQANLGIGDPEISVDNVQFGVFLQDDWDLTNKLRLNVGVRWDYETNAKNKNFVTPEPQANTLRALEEARAADRAAGLAAGLTPAVDAIDFRAENFISTGNNREAYKKAIAPRLGLSYDLFGDERTVLFGGWGRSFDKSLFRVAAEESTTTTFAQRNFLFTRDGALRNGQPTIVWDDYVALAQAQGIDPISKEGLQLLIDSGLAPGANITALSNDFKPPRADQFNFGVRQQVTLFNTVFQTSATYSHIRTKDDVAVTAANLSDFDRNDDGRLDILPTPKDFGNFNNVNIRVNGTRTRFNALFLTLAKPYTRDSGWGFDVAYTLAFAKESTARGDRFRNPDTAPFARNSADERHRIVISGIVDLPWGFKLSTLTELGTGLPVNVADASQGLGTRTNLEFRDLNPGLFGFKQVDLRLQKDFKTRAFGGDQTLSLFAEAINLFNTDNVGGRNNQIPFQSVNPAFGTPTSAAGPPRIIQFGTRISF